MKIIFHLSEMLFIPVSPHAYFWIIMILSFFTYLFLFNFELLINIYFAKFYKMNCTFLRNNCKNTPSLNQMNNSDYVRQPGKNCLHGEEPSQPSEISPALRWDLTWVGWIHSHTKDLFLRKICFYVYHTAEISLRWDVSRLTWVGWFFSYKQLLKE